MVQGTETVSSPPSPVHRQLPDEERIIDEIRYRPYFDFFFTPRIYYLTDRRVIYRRDGFWTTEHQDVPLREIISITHEKSFNPGVLVLGGIFFVFVLVVLDFVFFMLGWLLGLGILWLQQNQYGKATKYAVGGGVVVLLLLLVASIGVPAFLFGVIVGTGTFFLKSVLWAESFQIQTANPEVGIALPHSKQHTDIERFVQNIRQITEVDMRQ